jgi:hypothetical protein
MPRKPKSPEELEPFEGALHVDPIDQFEADKAERKDELERSIPKKPRQARAPRTKATEAAIEKAKAEIIEKMNVEERAEPSIPEESVWEKKTKIKPRTKKSLEKFEAVEERPEPIVPDKHIWDKKWESKNQAPKEEKNIEHKPKWWQLWKKDWFRKSSFAAKIMTLPTMAAAGGLSDSTTKPTDTLGKEAQFAVTRTIEQKTTPRLTEVKDIRDNKEFGDITLLGRQLVPYHNDSMEVCIAYFDGKQGDKKAMEKIIKAMLSEGYEPGDGKLLQEIVSENPILAKRAPYILALVPTIDKNDQETREIISTRTENYVPTNTTTISEEMSNNEVVAQRKFVSLDTVNKTKTVIEMLKAGHVVFPTAVKGKMSRFEQDQGIIITEHGYVFSKKKTPAQYEDGLAKK